MGSKLHLLSARRRRPYNIVVLIAFVAAAAVAIAVVSQGRSQSPEVVDLVGVPRDQLALNDFRLLAPSKEAAAQAIPLAEAVASIRREVPLPEVGDHGGDLVIDAKLVVLDTRDKTESGALVWAIAIDHMPPFSGPYAEYMTTTGSWFVHFVDARTGRWRTALAQGGEMSDEFRELERTGKLPPYQPTTDTRLYDPSASPSVEAQPKQAP